MTQPDSNHSVAIFDSLDLCRLQKLADLMVRHLPPGLALGLVGTLGAGKTTMVQCIARAIGVDSEEVTSPTFTLLQSHSGDLTLHHLDAYRIADSDEFLELGVDELFDDESAWTLVEWADRMPDVMPEQTLWVSIEIDPTDELLRTIHVRCTDANVRNAIQLIASAMG